MSVVAGTPVIDSPKACGDHHVVADLDLHDDGLEVERRHGLLDDLGDVGGLVGLLW